VLAAGIAALKPSRARALAAAIASTLVFAAFVTELQPLATHTFLWAHLLQNVVLAEWAPALLVLASGCSVVKNDAKMSASAAAAAAARAPRGLTTAA